MSNQNTNQKSSQNKSVIDNTIYPNDSQMNISNANHPPISTINNNSEDTEKKFNKPKTLLFKQSTSRKIRIDNIINIIICHNIKSVTILINMRLKELQKKSKKFSTLQNFILPHVSYKMIIFGNQKKKEQFFEPIKNIYLNSIAKKYNQDHNTKIIKIIEKEEEFKEINDALNLSILDIFKIYRGEENDTGIDFLNGLKELYDQFIEKLKGREDNEYMAKFINCMNKFEYYFRK